MEMGLDGAGGDEEMEAQEWEYCKIISTAVPVLTNFLAQQTRRQHSRVVISEWGVRARGVQIGIPITVLYCQKGVIPYLSLSLSLRLLVLTFRP